MMVSFFLIAAFTNFTEFFYIITARTSNEVTPKVRQYWEEKLFKQPKGLVVCAALR